MRKITIKLKDGSEFVVESKYWWGADLNQYILEGRQFIRIETLCIRIDSIEWVQEEVIESDEDKKASEEEKANNE